MDADRRGRQPHWAWALLLVAALHLTTSPGQWVLGDHAEMIVMSQRLIEHRSFTLADEGEHPQDLTWRPANKPRFFPGTSVALAPFVGLDLLLGWGHGPALGRLVHLGGHAFVLMALALMGAAVCRAGGAPSGAALAVVLVGTCFPVWKVARNSGAEPVVLVLIALFLWGSVTNSARAMLAAGMLLPWVHPTAVFLGPILAVFEPASGAMRRGGWMGAFTKRHLRNLVVSVVSGLSAVAIWNGLFHGSLRSGGYAGHIERDWFQHPWQEFTSNYLPQLVLMAPVILMTSLAAGWRSAELGRRRLLLASAVLAALAGFFSIFTPTLGQDHVRRLSVAWLAFGLVLGTQTARPDGASEGRWNIGLAVLSFLLGCYWFQLLEPDRYLRPGGPIVPTIFWITWWQQGVSMWIWGGSLVLLASTGALAAWKLGKLWLQSSRLNTAGDAG